MADYTKSSDGQILTSEALLEAYQNPAFAQFLKNKNGPPLAPCISNYPTVPRSYRLIVEYDEITWKFGISMEHQHLLFTMWHTLTLGGAILHQISFPSGYFRHLTTGSLSGLQGKAHSQQFLFGCSGPLGIVPWEIIDSSASSFSVLPLSFSDISWVPCRIHLLPRFT